MKKPFDLKVKSFFLIILLIIGTVIISSCKAVAIAEDIPSSKPTVSEDGSITFKKLEEHETTALSKPIEITDSSAEFTFKGLQAGKTYAIYPSSSHSLSTADIIIGDNEETGKTPFIETASGVLLFVATGSEMTFAASDLGLRTGDSFQTTQIKAKPISSYDEMVITAHDEAIIKDGIRYIDKIYTLSPRSFFTDPSGVAFMTIRKGSSSNTDTDEGIISENNERLYADGLLDLSAYDTITVYQMVHTERMSDDFSRKLILVHPEKLSLNTPQTLQSEMLYIIPQSSEELVLEIDIPENLNLGDYHLISSTPEGRYIDNGNRKPYIFPMYYDKENGRKLIAYVGSVPRDAMFNFIMTNSDDSSTATLRPITKSEEAMIVTFNPDEGEKEIQIPAGTGFVPIIFSSSNLQSYAGATISIEGELPHEKTSLYIMAGSSNGIGFASDRITNDKTSVKLPANRYPEYCYIFSANSSAEAGTVKLKITK